MKQGLAWSFLKFSRVYETDQVEAQKAKLGVWSGDFEAPWDFRAARWAEAMEGAPENCPIKDNISQNGKIYHVPWSTWYSRTKINPSKGERWFCDEAEAVAAR